MSGADPSMEKCMGRNYESRPQLPRFELLIVFTNCAILQFALQQRHCGNAGNAAAPQLFDAKFV